jgi:hypothetical protein
MAEKSYRFIEKTTRPEFDNGADGIYGYLHPFHNDATSVKNLIDQVLSDLKPGDCIKEIIIAGHGAPGNISVGNGTKGEDPAKEIGLGNEADWGPEFDRLKCKFCTGGTVYLRGCNVGDGQKGKDFLKKIAAHLACATLLAPTGLCTPYSTGGVDQQVNPNDDPPTPTHSNPDKSSGKKKKRGVGELKSLRAGPRFEELTAFDAEQIADARYLPRVLGESFSEDDLATERALELPAALVRQLSIALEQAVPLWLPAHAFSLDGYLQLQIERNGEKVWLPPGALVGGTTYYSVLRDDTTLTVLLAKQIRRQLERLDTQARTRRRA